MRDLFKPFRGGVAGGLLLSLAFVIAIGCVYVACSNSLHRTCFVTGWALFIALTWAFTRRVLRLRAGAKPGRLVGQQTSLVIAIGTLFLMHVEFSRPNGWLDMVLAGLFVVVTLSGAIGALLWTQLRSGSISAEFSTGEPEHALADAELRRRAMALLESIGAHPSVGSAVVIGDFFARRPRLWRRVFIGGDLARTLGAIGTLKADAGATDAASLDTLSSLAVEKDRLDGLRAGDSAVRRWLLVHLPCVACLLALGAMHGMIAHAHGLLAHVMLGK